MYPGIKNPESIAKEISLNRKELQASKGRIQE
jgi:hypothetical protein